MSRGSLRLRLLAAAVLSIALALFLTGLALIRLFEAEVRGRVEAELDTYLKQLIASAELAKDGRVAITGRLADPRFEQPFSGLYWEVRAGSPGQLATSRSMWDAELMGVPKAESGLTEGPEGEPIFFRSRLVTLGEAGKEVKARFTVALEEAELDAAVAKFSRSLALSLSIIGLALSLAAWVQVSVGLSPLAALRDKLAAIRRGEAHRLAGPFPDEVSPLAEEFNAVLDIQDKSLARARARAGDLAHGLKTPLAVLSAISRDIAASGLAGHARDIDAQTEQLRRHVERELARARMASGRFLQMTPLRPELERLIDAMKRSPRGADIAWMFDVPADAQLPIEGEDLTELLGNILDNARKWAGGRVSIAYADGILTIGDDGPGVAETRLDEIMERGARLDERSLGSGLGLAIVRDIGELYGLDIALARADLGGLAVSIGTPRGKLERTASAEPPLGSQHTNNHIIWLLE